LFFEKLDAECGLFFEDDLLLSPHYLDALLQLANFALCEPLVSYVAAYGEHTASLARQRFNSKRLIPMLHNWGFALTKRQWLQQKSIIDGYLSIIRDVDYKRRDHRRIEEYFASLGFAWGGSSQDTAKRIAGFVLGTTRLMCFPCFGQYIGREGLHFTPDIYDKLGYNKTMLYDQSVTEFNLPTRVQLLNWIDDERRLSRDELAGLSTPNKVADLWIQTSATDYVTELYHLLLGRDPDERGLNTWIGAVRTGYSLGEIAKVLVDSPEFKKKFTAASCQPNSDSASVGAQPTGGQTKNIEARQLSRETIIWSYRLLFNREPESEDAIRAHQSVGTHRELVHRLLTSREYVLAHIDHSERVLFESFRNKNATPRVGFVTDFLGTRIRTSSLWDHAKALDGRLLGIPVPNDFHAEAIEWIGLLSSVSTTGTCYRAMELGAGFGPWVVAGANAARQRGVSDIKLCAVEASPDRYGTLVQHFVDNGFDPADHILINAAVGTSAGEATWLVAADPINDNGSRPVTDGASTDYRGRPLDGSRTIKVPVVAFRDLLLSEPYWDLVHIDIQGDEFEVCQSCIAELDRRVRWLVVGTHSRKIEGDLIQLLYDAGWILHRENPCTFYVKTNRHPPSLEALTTADGTQVWFNPSRSQQSERS
jgi:FkbM family methyltransferase